MHTNRKLRVLLVEDNPGDIRLTREALRSHGIELDLSVATDGAEALETLYQKGKFVSTPLPDLVLLDFNLPKKNGSDVLATIKSDEALRYIPVIVLTTSNSESDIKKAYNLHANCFITKPVDFVRFLEVIKGIELFWLTIAKLPTVH